MAIGHRVQGSDFEPSFRQISDYRSLLNVTNAQALALFTTQLVLVAAQDTAGQTVLIADEVKIQYIAGGTAFTINGGGKFSVNYTNLAGLQAIQVATVGFVDQATTSATSYGLNVNVANGHLPTASAALVFGVTAANLTVGNGTFNVDLRYRIEPTAVR